MQSSLKSFFKAKDANTEPATAVSANQRPVKRKLDSVDPEPSVQQETKRFRKFLPQWKKAYSCLQHEMQTPTSRWVGIVDTDPNISLGWHCR